MNLGWVKLHRQLLENPIFKNDKLFRVFIYCLLKASHAENDQLVGDVIVPVKAGEFVGGRKKISADTGLTEQNVRTSLSKLEKLGILTIKPTNKYSLISIINWNLYQQDNQQVTSKQPASNQQVTTNKNVKNVKNDNNTSPVKPAAKRYKFNDDQMHFASCMYGFIKKVTPSMKEPNLEKWANDARMIQEIDGIELTRAWEVFVWANRDDFWKTNILSTGKFRDQFAKLEAKMNNRGGSQSDIMRESEQSNWHEQDLGL